MVRNGKNGGLHLKQISYYKQTGGYHSTTLASERSGIRRAAQKFVFKDNKLFYVGKDKSQMRLVIVSDAEKRQVLSKCHENPAGTHHGISRTLTLVESHYYWTSVTSDVKQWVDGCQHCHISKNTTSIAPKFHPMKAEGPWTTVIIELVGPFDVTSKNHVYVILLTDVFTKWVVALPLHNLSATEVAKAVVSALFLYGPPQKMATDQAEEFVHQINCELFEVFGTKELIISYPQCEHGNETGKRIRSFLQKYCMENTKDWDDHLSAIAFAFNLIHSETDQNNPYFQMFNRNPDMPTTLRITLEGANDCMLARIISAIKQAEQAVQERVASSCQMKMSVEQQQIGNLVHVKKKPTQFNPFLLKVGHEVLRQRKNWWKDGRFQSEWIGPCIIDYITDNGCAILRDPAGSRLKRPIKISHLKPFIRGSHEQDSSYIWQSAVGIDHDYIGTSVEQSPRDTFSAKETSAPAPDVGLLDKSNEFSDQKSSTEPESTAPNSTESVMTTSESWSAAIGALQTKIGGVNKVP